MANRLPKGWAITKIIETATTNSGGTPSTAKKEYWENGNVPWINSGKLKDRIISEPTTYITELGLNNSSAKLFPKFTTLIALTGATTGKVGLLDFECSANQSVTGIYPNNFNNTKYIFYFLIFSRDNILELSLGSAQPHINKNIVDNFPILFPPQNEQKRIVDKLDKLMERIEAVTTRLDKIPLLLKRFRQSVLAAAVSGKLTNKEREGDHIFEEIPLGNLIDDIKYGTSMKSVKEEIGIPILRIPNISEGKIDLNDLKYSKLAKQEYDKLKLTPGDVLIIRSNGSVSLVGKSAIVTENERDFAYAGYLIRVRCNRRKLLPEYLNLSLASNNLRTQIELPARSTSGVNNINTTEIRSLLIPTPEIEEQEEIVRRVEALFKTADKLEERYKKAKAYTDKLKQSILAKAFRGELLPQDPNDEPASVLLEKIKKEKEKLNVKSKRRKDK